MSPPESQTPAAERPQTEVVVDGEVVNFGDFTFREQREVRAVVRNELALDPDIDFEDLPLMDYLPALIFVFKKRTESGYTLDQALDVKASDVLRTADERPTRRGRQKKS